MSETKEQTVLRLENLVRKVKLQSQDSSDVESRILVPQAQGNPYIIEVSLDRFVRRVPVDLITVQRIHIGRPDPALVRDLRTAIMAVIRLARSRQ